MKKPRRDFPLKEQLAAALRQMVVRDENGQYAPAIPWEHARQMTADQVLSLFNRDHYPIRYEQDGPNLHWNCQWRFIGEHKAKTTKVDVPQAAKSKRVARAFDKFVSGITPGSGFSASEVQRAWDEGTDAQGINIITGNPKHSRPRPKAKIKSAGFRGSKKFDGTVTWSKKQKSKVT